MSGLTSEGFDRKRLVDIISDIEDGLKTAFGENIDLTPESKFGQFVSMMSEKISNQWQSQENIYLSQSPSTASNNNLSNVVLLNGITRNSESFSTSPITISGLENTVIPAGSEILVDGTNAIFLTDEEITIPVSGTIDSTATAKDSGPIQAVAGTLTIIGSAVYGWTGVTNAEDATLGENEETDPELRERRENSILASACNLVDALYAQLLDLDGVTDVRVKDNKTDSTVDGIPARQFQATVAGGDEDEIVATIWNNTPQGINSYGTSSAYITDSQGELQEVFYTIPDNIDIYFNIEIEVNSNFPATGVDDLKESIIDYGVENFKINDEVIRTAFYTAINEIPGITDITVLEIGLTAGSTTESNITIGSGEQSNYDESFIAIGIV